jgi:hypothetical protein
MASTNSQIPAIYAAAIIRYREITNKDLNAAFFSRLATVEDLMSEVDARNNSFSEFRKERSAIFNSLQIAMKPIELIGNVASGGASMAFPPPSLGFGAVTYLINAAKGMTASYNAIQELMQTLKVTSMPNPMSFGRRTGLQSHYLQYHSILIQH